MIRRGARRVLPLSVFALAAFLAGAALGGRTRVALAVGAAVALLLVVSVLIHRPAPRVA
ncbi:MAG TPA: hypothetical protein VKW09_13185 [bacterium]|nr:hypothetical protein [bacterium]